MKEIIKFGVIVLVMVTLTSKVKSGKIPLPTFITNSIDLKKMTDGDTIYIQGLGNYSNSTLRHAKQIVEETYGVPTKIIDPIQLSSDYYINGLIDCEKSLEDFDNNQNKILLTDDGCYSVEDNNTIGGLGELYGNIIIVGKNRPNELKRVIIHEIGHNLGLSHCDNSNCVMSENRSNDVNTITFCEKCRKN
jgi:archaemetzincin